MKNWTKEKFLTARGYAIKNRKKSDLTASMEDYLEMIYRLCQENGFTRVNDVALALNVQAPSVTKMVQKLKEINLVSYEKYGIIKLTTQGKELGEYLLIRHNTLYSFLELIGTDGNIHEEVEGIEHNISKNTMKSIIKLVDFFKEYPHIRDKFQNYPNKSMQNLK